LEEVNTLTYFGGKISYEEEKRHNLKNKQIFTNVGNSEKCFETIFIAQTIYIETVYYFSHPVTCVLLLNLDIETRGYKKSKDWRNEARFEVFAVVKIQVEVFWVVTSCSDVVRYHRFGGFYCLHLQGEVHGAGKCGIRV